MSAIPSILVRLSLALVWVLACANAWAAGVSVTAATEKQKKEASDAYAAAKMSYDAGKREEALVGFRKSYDIVASPNSHLMVARTLSDLGRNVEAYNEVKVTVLEAEEAARSSAKYAQTRETAKQLEVDLRKRVGMLTIEIQGGMLPDGSSLEVQGKPVTYTALSVVVEPGEVRVTLKTPHGVDEEVAMVQAGGQASVVMTPPIAPEPEPQPEPIEPIESPGSEISTTRMVVYVAGGVGIAGFLVFGVFGSLTLARFNDLEDACPNEACPPERQDDIDSGQGYQTAANVGLIFGVSGLIVAGALLLMESDIESASLHLVPHPGGAAVGGRF